MGLEPQPKRHWPAGRLATNTFPQSPNLFDKLQGCHENNAETLKIIA